MGWRANSFMAVWSVFLVFLQDAASSQVLNGDTESADWSRALGRDTAEAYFEFLMLHPRGLYFEDAVNRLYVIGALNPVDDIIQIARTAALVPAPTRKKARPAGDAVRSAPVANEPVASKKKASIY